MRETRREERDLNEMGVWRGPGRTLQLVRFLLGNFALCPLPEAQECLLLCMCPYSLHFPLFWVQLRGIWGKRWWLTLTLSSITRNQIDLCFNLLLND